jgi:hypothetical protein
VPFTLAVTLAGLGQVGLALASLTFPKILHWDRDLAPLRPLLRRFFWIYAAYIFAINLAFGLLSWLRPAWLLDASPLAAAVSGFIALYWTARLGLQLFGFDRSDMPLGARYRAAEGALVLLFTYLSGVYLAVFLAHLT